MTEWMSHDGYGVEGQDVCSPASHQAKCGVAFDMGHLWPAGRECPMSRATSHLAWCDDEVHSVTSRTIHSSTSYTS